MKKRNLRSVNESESQLFKRKWSDNQGPIQFLMVTTPLIGSPTQRFHKSLSKAKPTADLAKFPLNSYFRSHRRQKCLHNKYRKAGHPNPFFGKTGNLSSKIEFFLSIGNTHIFVYRPQYTSYFFPTEYCFLPKCWKEQPRKM